MMLTIKAKLILAYTAVFGAMLVVFALLVYQSSRDAETAKLDAHLESQAERLQSEIEEQQDEGVFPVMKDLTSIRTEGLVDFHFRVLDSTGVAVVGDTVLASLPGGLHSYAVQGSPRAEDIILDGKGFRALVFPADINENVLYVLHVVASKADVDATLRHLRLLFVIVIPAVLLLTTLAAYFITRTAFRPITTMIETSRTISAENLESRLQLPKVNDEIRQLGETLNTMMERINKAFNLQRQFMADASHEFRTPLTVMCSELEFAQKRTSDEQARESIGTALVEIDRLAKMTEGMLMLSRSDSSQLTLYRHAIRLDELLIDSIQLLKPLCIQKQIDLQVHVDDAVEINGDRDKLKSAIINLLDNAIKYSKPCGVIRVALCIDDHSPSSVRIGIEDNGPGIASSDLPHVFERFYRSATSRAESSGSGLGLAIVDQVVKMHGGRVDVQSAIGKGSTFTMELPIQSPS